jgi:hypothetical protein
VVTRSISPRIFPMTNKKNTPSIEELMREARLSSGGLGIKSDIEASQSAAEITGLSSTTSILGEILLEQRETNRLLSLLIDRTDLTNKSLAQVSIKIENNTSAAREISAEVGSSLASAMFLKVACYFPAEDPLFVPINIQ